MTPEERQQFSLDIAAAIQTHITVLTEEEVTAIRQLIRKQEQQIALRQAIIEKTLSGLAWAALLGIFYICKEWAAAHGYKP
jgi:hypothetical protein